MKLTDCPACGRRTLRAVEAPVTFEVRGKTKSIPNVPHLCCSSCGQRFFDRESNHVLDAHRGRRRARGAA